MSAAEQCCCRQAPASDWNWALVQTQGRSVLDTKIRAENIIQIGGNVVRARATILSGGRDDTSKDTRRGPASARTPTWNGRRHGGGLGVDGKGNSGKDEESL